MLLIKIFGPYPASKSHFLPDGFRTPVANHSIAPYLASNKKIRPDVTDLILISDSAEGFAIRRRIFAVEHEVSAEIFLSDNRIFCQLLRSALKRIFPSKKAGRLGR